MQAAVRTESGVVVLDLQGRLDAASVREFRRVAHGQLRAGQRRLVVDLSGVEGVDGMGLAGLVSFYRKAVTEDGGRLVIAGANPEVRLLLDRTTLSRVIPVAPDWQVALDEVRR